MVRFLRIFLLILPVTLRAQFTYVIDQTIPVKDDQGNPLTLPWAGGLNAAHYNTMDLNGDGREDLVLFDRMADKILTFTTVENKYQYSPEFENFFPEEITNWFLLRDYNCDGKKDIFTGDILGIKVYMNISSSGSPPAWEQFLFHPGGSGSLSKVLLTKGFSGKINLQLQFDDLPSITDADGDGDLDIFNVRFAGEGTIEFHKNFSQERYGTCDSLDFERITQKWGDVTECDCGEFAFHNEECAPMGGRVKHAGGKSLLLLDVDGNASLDVLFSEASCRNLYLLPNEGSTVTPMLNSFTSFPAASPVDFLIFPAAFYEDVDFDGKKDLISTPNIFAKASDILNADLSRSNWLYKNSGTNSSPDFSYTTSSFLQDQMIDVGDNAVPAFNDFDDDGDLDMFISQNNGVNSLATIRLYENIGTSSNPEFTLINNNIFGFSDQPFYNLKIQFADIDHDSKVDLVFTGTSIFNGLTQLYYISNKANNGLDLSGQPIQPTNFTLFSSENIFLVDVDSDGFQDLLLGKNTGSLEYWKNQGTSSVNFSREDDSYLNLTSSVLRQNMSGTATDLDADGRTDLILSDQNGQLNIVGNFREATDAAVAATSEIIFNPLLGEYKSKNLGGRIWPTTANLFGTNKPSLVVGNVLGGIYLLRNDEEQSLPNDPVVHIYPNPSARGENVSIKIDRAAALQLYSSLGQELTSPIALPANEFHQFKMPHQASGVYIFRFTTRGKSFSKRIVVY